MADETIQYPGWEVVRELGAGSYGKVFEVKKEDSFGETENSALKHIRIPPETVSLQSYSDEMGLDDQSLSAMFRKQMENIANEFSLMSKLKGNSYIVSYEDHTVIPHENGMGYDIYIRMELLKPLTSLLREKYGNTEIDENLVVKLGQDMCHALDLCERNAIIHRDIKPQNIFLSRQGNFKLGDFGIAKNADHSTIGTRTGTFNYMAPEVYASKPYDHTVDLYSLGMVLYWMLNERRGPFLPLPPAVPTAEASSEAVGRRMNGEPIPAPKNGTPELKRIVLKAISFEPAARYQNAREMLRDLMRLGQSEAGQNAPQDGVLPSSDQVAAPKGPAPKTAPKPVKTVTHKVQDGKKKKKLWLIPVIIGGALILLISGLLIIGAIVRNSSEKAAEKEAQESRKRIPQEVLYTNWVNSYASYRAKQEYRKMTIGDIEYELRAYPSGISKVMNAPAILGDVIGLVYLDRYDEIYKLYANFTFEDGVLKLEPPANEAQIEDILPLSEPITYYLSSWKKTSGKLRMSTVGHDDDASYAEYVNNYNSDNPEKRIIQGSASDPEHCYKELLSLDLIFLISEGNYEPRQTSRCRIFFSDGGYAVEPKIRYYYDSTSGLSLEWKSRMIFYNGRLQDDGKTGSYSSIRIINCYPNGFIIYDEYNDEYFIYQDPVKEVKN